MEHGHWKEKQYCELRGYQYCELRGYTCSNCGWNFATTDWELDISNFEHCPHCGAKMDEDK